MSTKKKTLKSQQYDNYWKLTVAYTDIHNFNFRDTLKMTISFIDTNKIELSKDDNKKMSSELYRQLQHDISLVNKLHPASIRKSINQFIKLGFVKPRLKDYHQLAKRFLNSSSREERELIFSQIYYLYASFSSSFENDNTDKKEMKFLLKTLMYHPNKKLTKEDIIGLMVTDVSSVDKGFLTQEELIKKYDFSKVIGFEEKKYNQVGYFYRFLKLVPGIIIDDHKEVAYKEDASNVLSEEIDTERDQTLFRIMRENLKRESREIYEGKEVCYFSKLETKGLVTSHIWRSEDALREMDIEAAYDYKNALLLEGNVDAYFDKYDLTFIKDGSVKYGTEVTNDFKNRYVHNSLDYEILTDDRVSYLNKHNKNFVNKNDNG